MKTGGDRKLSAFLGFFGITKQHEEDKSKQKLNSLCFLQESCTVNPFTELGVKNVHVGRL